MTAPERLRQAKAVAGRLARTLAALAALCLLPACALQRQQPLSIAHDGPGIADGWFTSFDGARLGLTLWPGRSAGSTTCAASGGQGDGNQPETCLAAWRDAAPEPETVIVALHGMNDYAGAFMAAGDWWSRNGAIVYAYDQRGFGRSPRPGVWPEEDLLVRDLKAIVAAARRKHPSARIAVVGESMGAAVAAIAFASDDPPEADALILSGPGFRGWSALPPLYSASLWASAHIRPGWKVVPPKGIIITPTDNRAKQVEMWYDPYVLKETRIDSVYGVVSVMEQASKALKRLPPDLPVLLLYGARDQVIPEAAVRQATDGLPDHVRSAYYADGYHMLMNDLQAHKVWADVLAFARQPAGTLPSGSPDLPWLSRRGQAGSADATPPEQTRAGQGG